MAEVIPFRTKKLTGFIPDQSKEAETLKSDRSYARHNPAEPFYDDGRPCDSEPPPEVA